MEFANKRWTDEQRQYVIDVWGEIPTKRIAKNVGKSLKAIERFAQRNNLGGAVFNDMYLTTVKASEIIGVDPTTVLAWVKDNKLKARKQTLLRRKVYLIDPNDFRVFLRENQDKWNATKLQEGFFDADTDWLIKKMDVDSQPLNKKKRASWTVKEEQRLVELVKLGFTNLEISKELNRTINSVSNKRLRLIKGA